MSISYSSTSWGFSGTRVCSSLVFTVFFHLLAVLHNLFYSYTFHSVPGFFSSTVQHRSGWFLGLRSKASHLSMPRGEYREGELPFDLFWVGFGFRGFLPPAVV